MIRCHYTITLLRVPNRFFGIRDLAYLKAGIRDFIEKEDRDSGSLNFERDTGFGDLTERDSGNVILKSRDPAREVLDENVRTQSCCHRQECR